MEIIPLSGWIDPVELVCHLPGQTITLPPCRRCRNPAPISDPPRPYLERRFSILFNHYESHDREAVQWLVQALENMNLALTANFGAVKLTLLR